MIDYVVVFIRLVINCFTVILFTTDFFTKPIIMCRLPYRCDVLRYICVGVLSLLYLGLVDKRRTINPRDFSSYVYWLLSELL